MCRNSNDLGSAEAPNRSDVRSTFSDSAGPCPGPRRGPTKQSVPGMSQARVGGYGSCDNPTLLEGTLPQPRMIQLSPRPAGAEDLARLLEDSLAIWRERARRGAMVMPRRVNSGTRGTMMPICVADSRRRW